MPNEEQLAANNPPNDTLLPWNMGYVNGDPNNHHNVRVLCDLCSLTEEQKNILTACVRVESDFNTQITHSNYAYTLEGVKFVASTDFGIVQINSYWNIGDGKPFPSSEYVLQNPEACVRFMCNYYKQNGNLDLWCSYTSGAYLKFLGKV